LKRKASECLSNRNTIESSDIDSEQLVTLNEFKDTATASSDTNTTAVSSGVDVVRVFDLSDDVVTRYQPTEAVDPKRPRIILELPPEMARRVCPHAY
jgi:hypothetical protein